MTFDAVAVKNLLKHTGGSIAVQEDDIAFSYCKKMTLGHYENFPVGSILLPKRLRGATYAIYVFSRLGDTIADEDIFVTPEEKLRHLDLMAEYVQNCKTGSTNPLWRALAITKEEFGLPDRPFLKLLEAFRRDVLFKQPATWADIEDYCVYSANPVGELVLRLHGYYTPATAPLSDAICTGLQAVNFWQDLSRDIAAGRSYIPLEIAKKYGMEGENLDSSAKSPNLAKYSQCIEELLDTTYQYFHLGKNLLCLLPSIRLRAELSFIVSGGVAILKKVRKLGGAAFMTRPSLKSTDYIAALHLALRGTFLPASLADNEIRN